MTDLSFRALQACSLLAKVPNVRELRIETLAEINNLTHASAGVLLGFDLSGSSIISLVNNNTSFAETISLDGSGWPDHPINYLFSLKKCAWEGGVHPFLIEARQIIFGNESFGRTLVIPGRTRREGYAEFVSVVLVASNIRPTRRSFSIFLSFGEFSAHLLKQRILSDNWQPDIPHSPVIKKTPPRVLSQPSIKGSSRQIKELRENITRFAPSTLNVLVTGETGTGKEIVARSLHDQSLCHTGPFVAVNTTTLPTQLIESELFGHVRGAFTGANENHQGLILKAHKGTLFLDEIGDLPFDLQAKLLRVLQERRFRPVGGMQEITSDFRLITATHRNLEAMVDAGEFRQDLYYRLKQAWISIPPLRERGQDILELAEYLLNTYAERTGQPEKYLLPETRRKLMDHPFPGNVRELFAIVEQAIMAAGENLFLHPDHFYEHSPAPSVSSDLPTGMSLSDACAAFERSILLKAYQTYEGNRKTIAQKLGLPLRTLSHKFERYKIE